MPNRRTRGLCAAPLLLVLGACSSWFFSGVPYPDRTRPVVRIETRGGVEYGAATEFGVLFLGRTATEGPCRVRFYVGEQLITDDGTIEPFGGVFVRAAIDLRHQAARVWTAPLRRSDPLVAMVIADRQVVEVPVQISGDEFASGDVLDHPGRELPIGTPLFVRVDTETRHFAGLVSGAATLEVPDGPARQYFVFAGPARLGEALAIPENDLAPVRIRYRPDGIWVEEQDRRGTDG
jgi:hypothetical protein